MFVDKVKIFIEAGRGGDGCVSFRREKYVPRGGPDGGNGGKGGDVYLICNPNMTTLYDFTLKRHFKAEDGKPGMSKNKTGKSGDDLYIDVPSGTVVYRVNEERSRLFVADLVSPGERVLVATGGRGGRGNASFKSQRNRTPRISERGEPCESVTLELELKLIAAVGIIGCPNAGKSTLLSRITSAKPKIASYPFTTTSPNLGICNHKGKSFVIADIPGLIEGAHKGRGLGDEFLRHIERTKILVHIVDVHGYENKSAFKNFLLVNKELKKYSAVMSKKPMIVVLNKIDILDDLYKKISEFKRNINKKFAIFPISAVTGEGITKLLDKIVSLLSKDAAEDFSSSKPKEIHKKEYKIQPEFSIEKCDNIFIVKGKKVENLVAMVNFNQEESVKRLQNIFKKIGLERALKKSGAKPGQTVKINNYEFEYQLVFK
ncbi:MAG: GTPase ObgE [Elusimicrobiota bacterium]|nr:GTPase ObgE [Elusimicrobiota bacterium]